MKNLFSKKVIIVLVIIVAAILALFNIFRSKNLSKTYLTSSNEEERSFTGHYNQKVTGDSIKFDFKIFNGKWSIFEFDSPKDNKITIEDKSKINKGKFYIVVLDSNYKDVVIKEENENKNLEFVTPHNGKYLIRIVGKKASGYFNIKVRSKENIKMIYKDFWS